MRASPSSRSSATIARVTFSPVDDANGSIATVVLADYDWTATGLAKADWVAANIDFA